MKPFASIQSDNFRLLLTLIRGLSILMILLLVVAFGLAIFSIFNNGLILMAMAIAARAASALIILSVVAILISIEEYLRLQTLRFVQKSKMLDL